MPEKRTTIADIARTLQVSMHTVNKALYGKKGVGEELRAKILQTAQAMNYRANRVAQSMARKPMTIGIITHASSWPMIRDAFLSGIRAAVEQLRDYNVNGAYYHFSSSEERAEAIGQAVDDGVNVVICLHFVPDEAETARLQAGNVPFALLGTDGLEDRRLTCVRADGRMAGKIVAELMAMALPPSSPIVAFTGFKNYRDHADKIDGFTAEMNRRQFRKIFVYEHFDQPETAGRGTRLALTEHPDLAAVYAATANVATICRELAAASRHPLVIATDIYPEIKDLMRSGAIAASIYQNAPDQGRKLVELLYAALCENRTIPAQICLSPTIVLPANLDAFSS